MGGPTGAGNWLGLRWRYWLLTAGITGTILVIRLGVRTPGLFAADVGAVGAYVTAIGTLYGILAAFTIYVVWTQFNDAKTAAESETNELLDLYRFAIYLRDPSILERLHTAIKAYCVSVARVEWPAISSRSESEETGFRFEEVFQTVHSVRFDDERDVSAWEMMISKFESVSDARSKRLSLAVSGVPRLLRILIYLVSLALIVGFFVLAIANDIVAIVVTVATSAIVFLVIEVIEDLDDPFGGQWAVTPDLFERLPEQLDAFAT